MYFKSEIKYHSIWSRFSYGRHQRKAYEMFCRLFRILKFTACALIAAYATFRPGSRVLFK
jgi:hypothetical protein